MFLDIIVVEVDLLLWLNILVFYTTADVCKAKVKECKEVLEKYYGAEDETDAESTTHDLKVMGLPETQGKLG